MLENFRIRVFRAVAHHLNFSRAAEELLLTQPAVTQQIKALEEQIGLPLFDRGGGRITLTPGGHALVPFAYRMGLTRNLPALKNVVFSTESYLILMGGFRYK